MGPIHTICFLHSHIISREGQVVLFFTSGLVLSTAATQSHTMLTHTAFQTCLQCVIDHIQHAAQYITVTVHVICPFATCVRTYGVFGDCALMKKFTVMS